MVYPVRMSILELGQIKNICVYGNRTPPKFTRETQNVFQVFWKKNNNFMHFERQNAFQNA